MKNVVRSDEAAVQEADWGTLKWLVGAHNESSEGITLGRVTLKPGQENPPHHHPNCEEVLYVVAGEIEHTLPEGGTVVLRQGDCIVLPKGIGHQAKNVGAGEATVIVVFNSGKRETIGE